MSEATLRPVGTWRPGATPPSFSSSDVTAAAAQVRETVHIVREAGEGRVGLAPGPKGCEIPWVVPEPRPLLFP